ncbi:hypothetical protein ES703_94083 [subsurface metagenome]
MKRRLIKAIKGEKGQALPIVLVLLLLGGLLVAPSLSYASTSLNVGQIVEKNVKGLYAADAGVEDALWRIENDPPPSSYPDIYPLPENVNQMQVSTQTDIIGIYTLYFGDLIVVDERPQGQEHYKWLTVAGEMVWVEEVQSYEYTITVTRQPQADGNISLQEIGVRLPLGYSYVLDSAADLSFADNLSTDEPDDTLDEADAHMLNWELPDFPELSYLNPTRTQTFYVIGEGSQDGDYTWVGAVRQDVGQVGEVIGGLYRITATATIPGDGEITVMADVMWNETTGEITILLWQINPQ